jgi:protein-S-isoprenylcysteine O-methyltransferase Ste14
MLKAFDIPPIWLGVALLVTWVIGKIGGFWPAPLGGAMLIGFGMLLMALAALQMTLARTTIWPRRNPSALVTGGVFAMSRNPIYLGDAVVLTGALAFWGAWAALPLVALFCTWITRRYILDEEARLRAGFGAEFEAWAALVPRWFWRV